MEAEAPGEFDLCSANDLLKAEAAHIRGDKTASVRVYIYCLEKGIVPPEWAVPTVKNILENHLNKSRTKETHKKYDIYTARAAALGIAEDHLGFGCGYDTSKEAVAELAADLLSKINVTNALEKREIFLADKDTTPENLRRWWYGKKTIDGHILEEFNRSKYCDPNYSLLGIFYAELGE